MTTVTVEGASYRYGRDTRDALHDVSLEAPSGAILGLLGTNGAGKTTLLQCCAGLREPLSGRVLIDGASTARRALIVSGVVGYVAESVRLPKDMTLQALERWVAPLHRRWDAALATSLRERFALDAGRSLTTLSRGEYMKAALLCVLAAQPRVLIMDEPLAGIDVVTKDEILRVLLSIASSSGTTMLLASHDIAEVESVLSHVVIMTAGRVRVAGSMESVRERYRRVTMVGGDALLDAFAGEQRWLETQRAGRVLSIVADGARTPLDAGMLQRRFAGADSITVEDLSLRDLYSSVVRGTRRDATQSEAA
ncbi:MAG: ABC transporter ATP-binding protein [Gemmatimonadaceae bacterium]|nr:ABC transporter ATP-binding protein [Gemmatimonadaceae bacterium]